MNRPPPPPRLGTWLLERLRPHGDSDVLLGDFEEEYHYLRTRYGVPYARRWYGKQVLLSFPGFATQLVYWSLTMLKNYLTIAGRQLLKNGRYTVINVFGLAVALACCIVAYLNYNFSYGFDDFHDNADRIYRVNSTRIINDSEQAWGITPMPLGPAIKAEFPFIEEAVRVSRTDAVFQYEEKVFNETVHFADAAFFDLFTFPLQRGTSAVLREPGQIVLSPEMAVKYFGQENPIGRQVTLRFDDEVRSFTVGAVVEEIPQNSSLRFDILLAYDNLRVLGDDLDDWKRWGLVTFLDVSDPAPLAGLSDRLTAYLELQNAARPDWKIERFDFVPFPEMFLTSRETRAYILTESFPPAGIVSPAVIALLLLLMACFNFMNTAVAFAGKRLKEIGLRKVMGGLRRQLIAQFMGESMLLCVIAFALSLLLAEIFAPAYSSLWPYLDLQVNYADNASLLMFLAGLLLITGLIAGAYPAFYISSFNPVSILKGRQQLAGLNLFTRTLLTLQLTIAVMVILAGLVFTNNARFQETIDLGFEMDTVIMVPLGKPERFTAYRDALAQNPDILSVAGSRSHVAYSYFDRLAETLPTGQREAIKGEIDLYHIGEAYLETMELRILDGRAFDPDMETDFIDAMLVNQTFARQFGLSKPVGETVIIDSTRYEVVGVFEDFYDAGVWNPIDPAAFRFTTPDQYYFLTARVRANTLEEANIFLQETWQRLVPEEPYGGIYQNEVLAEAIWVNRSIKTTFYYIALLAIVIAAAGLYGLMSLAIARRTKEIGIRKVLGASVLSVGHLINKEFVVMLSIASVAASVTGYFMIKMMLDSIWAYHAGVGLMPILLASLLIFVIALTTVGWQVYKIATANPVHALRYE